MKPPSATATTKPAHGVPPAPRPLDWLDTPELRRRFANWLRNAWPSLCHDSIAALVDTKRILDSMEQAVKDLARSLPRLHPADQLHKVATTAVTCSLRLDETAAIDLLRFELKHTGPIPAKDEDREHWQDRRKMLSASPWQPARAQMHRQIEQFGRSLCRRRPFYPGSPDCQFALHCVTAILSVPSISHGPLAPTPAQRRDQRALWLSVRWCCSRDSGPKRLADFIVALLRSPDWPRVPAGLHYNLADHFNDARRLSFIRHHLRHSRNAAEARRLWWIARAAVCDDTLCHSLAQLARYADAHRREKGWPYLRNALAAALGHITRTPKVSEQLRDFELDHYPELAHTTPDQRATLLPEIGRDQDTRRRPLTRRERVTLASKWLKLDDSKVHAGTGKSSLEVLHARAMKAVRARVQSS